MKKLLAVALAALVAALVFPVAAEAAMPTLGANFHGGGITLESAGVLVGEVNGLFAVQDGLNLRLTLGGATSTLSSNPTAPCGFGGVNITFRPSEEIVGGLEQASGNSLPLFEGSGFCAKLDEDLVGYLTHPEPEYAAFTALVLAHAVGHMLGLDHEPGTIMSVGFEGHKTFNSEQVATLNQSAVQATKAPVKAAMAPLRHVERFNSQFEYQGGFGKPVALTPDSGYFWFFDQTNIEVTVKVLDACAINDRFWVYAAAMTDLEGTLTVTDTVTGEKRVYYNPPGPFMPITDTDAFTCP